MTNELLDLVPTHQRALGNRAYYQEEIQKKTNESRRKRGEDGTEETGPANQAFTIPEKKIKTVEEMTERERYEMLCRGEIAIPASVRKELKCRYVDRGIPYLKIGPFKEEEAFLEPRIVVYHDVINDEEIETIKRMAQPRVIAYSFDVHSPAVATLLDGVAVGDKFHCRLLWRLFEREFLTKPLARRGVALVIFDSYLLHNAPKLNIPAWNMYIF